MVATIEQEGRREDIPRVYKSTGGVQIAVPPEFSNGSRKLMNTLIYDFQNNSPEEGGIYRVPLESLSEPMGFNVPRNQNIMWRYVRSLRDLAIEWNVFGTDNTADWSRASSNKKKGRSKDGERRRTANFLIFGEIGGGELAYALNPHLPLEVIHRPKLYADFYLRIQTCFSQKASLPLYEFFKNELCIKNRDEVVIEQMPIEDLGRLLRPNKDGRSTTEYYSSFGILNKKVLKPSIQEINKESDILVDYSKVREKYNKVVALDFYIQKKPESRKALLECHAEEDSENPSVFQAVEVTLTDSEESASSEEQEKSLQALVAEGITPERAGQLSRERTFEEVQRAIQYFHKRQAERNRKIKRGEKSPSQVIDTSYLVKAVENDSWGWTPPARSSTSAQTAFQFKKDRKKQKTLEAEWQAYRDDQVWLRFEALDQKDQETLWQRFLDYVAEDLRSPEDSDKARQEVENHGELQTRRIQAIYKTFLFEQLAEAPEERDFESYLATFHSS